MLVARPLALPVQPADVAVVPDPDRRVSLRHGIGRGAVPTVQPVAGPGHDPPGGRLVDAPQPPTAHPAGHGAVVAPRAVDPVGLHRVPGGVEALVQAGHQRVRVAHPPVQVGARDPRLDRLVVIDAPDPGRAHGLGHGDHGVALVALVHGPVGRPQAHRHDGIRPALDPGAVEHAGLDPLLEQVTARLAGQVGLVQGPEQVQIVIRDLAGLGLVLALHVGQGLAGVVGEQDGHPVHQLPEALERGLEQAQVVRDLDLDPERRDQPALVRLDPGRPLPVVGPAVLHASLHVGERAVKGLVADVANEGPDGDGRPVASLSRAHAQVVVLVPGDGVVGLIEQVGAVPVGVGAPQGLQAVPGDAHAEAGQEVGGHDRSGVAGAPLGRELVRSETLPAPHLVDEALHARREVRDRTDQPDLAVQAHLAGVAAAVGLDRLGDVADPVQGGAGRRDQLRQPALGGLQVVVVEDGQRWKAGGHVFTQRRVTAIVESVDALLRLIEVQHVRRPERVHLESELATISGRLGLKELEQVARQSVSLGAAGLGCSLHEELGRRRCQDPPVQGPAEPARARVTVHGQQGLGRDQALLGVALPDLHHLGLARVTIGLVDCVDRHAHVDRQPVQAVEQAREGRDQHTRSGDGRDHDERCAALVYGKAGHSASRECGCAGQPSKREPCDVRRLVAVSGRYTRPCLFWIARIHSPGRSAPPRRWADLTS